MNGQRRTFLTITGVVLLLAAAAAEAAAAEQAKPAVQPPAASTKQPNDEGAPTKLVPPVRGEAEIGYTNPVTKNDGKFITTTIKIKNMSKGAIAGLKVDEFWYDKDGNPVTGAQPFRYRKPLQPGEVIDVVLKVPRDPRMSRNQYQFEHANGKIKTTKLAKL